MKICFAPVTVPGSGSTQAPGNGDRERESKDKLKLIHDAPFFRGRDCCEQPEGSFRVINLHILQLCFPCIQTSQLRIWSFNMLQHMQTQQRRCSNPVGESTKEGDLTSHLKPRLQRAGSVALSDDVGFISLNGISTRNGESIAKRCLQLFFWGGGNQDKYHEHMGIE